MMKGKHTSLESLEGNSECSIKGLLALYLSQLYGGISAN